MSDRSETLVGRCRSLLSFEIDTKRRLLDRRIFFHFLFDYPGLLTGSPLGNTRPPFHPHSHGLSCAPCAAKARSCAGRPPSWYLSDLARSLDTVLYSLVYTTFWIPDVEYWSARRLSVRGGSRIMSLTHAPGATPLQPFRSRTGILSEYVVFRWLPGTEQAM